ncbi:type I phosphomannose isomerase catalytic subunit [Anatilimnocola floriformis]|uniref:type I phosphomannose isomerase catalytic subunit n=1 Tax=Anatilimnocola floriformis TaxID=2948575 RepID=UPI0020C21642|nr:type I phosphomannose isomerase catalytic subunit [Anatilimnocola floriformis]
MTPLYPFRFEPLYKRYLWGGRRLADVLGKQLPPGDDYAESWEVADHASGQSVVAAGPLAGTTLHQLVTERGAELLGRHAPQPGSPQARFPLLFKLLDAQKVLSVQVHPDDAGGAKLTPPDLGKTEAWVVLHAEPGSVVYAGLKRGFDRPALEREVIRGTSELCLHKIEPKVGDCIFIPAGVVHALGAGIVIAEIQQASDTTFRLYDWKRVGADGKERPLHIQQSLDAIDYQIGPVNPQRPRVVEESGVRKEELVRCDKFELSRWQLSQPQAIGGDGRCYLICVLEGEVAIEGDAAGAPLKRGQTILVPASVATNLSPSGSATVLISALPS